MPAEPDSRPEPQFVLASTSPRRSELLARAGIGFVLGEPGTEPEDAGVPLELALERAQSKARFCRSASHPGLPILGVDTVVDLDGREVRKPRDRLEAEAFLRRLAGREHRVHTAHFLCLPAVGFEVSEIATSRVACAPVHEGELARYLDSGEWRGKAGAYGIQDREQGFVRLVEGAFDTVVGLHVEAVRRLLRHWHRR